MSQMKDGDKYHIFHKAEIGAMDVGTLPPMYFQLD